MSKPSDEQQSASQFKGSAVRNAVSASKNPYGGGPNTGITLPQYYRTTPSVKNANTLFPGIEELADDESR